MDDELSLLEALYPELKIDNSGPSVNLEYEHCARIGKVKLQVRIEEKAAYPEKCRPICSIRRGLSHETEQVVIGALRNVIESSCGDFCLVQVLTTFIACSDDIIPVCGICLDDVGEDILVTEPCSHIFHRSTCFNHWVTQSITNDELSSDAKFSQTRRRQRESTAEAELRMNLIRIQQFEADRTVLTARKELLQRKLDEILKPQSVATTKKNQGKNAASERDFDDEDVNDPIELQRRMAIVQQSMKANTITLAGIRKSQTAAETNLRLLRNELAREMNEEAQRRQQAIPCPVCRTSIDASRLME